MMNVLNNINLKDNNPLVSIIVNNYNNDKYISECLESLLSQTYQHIEIVVVDAFSTDSSRLIIDSYVNLDSRIKKVYCKSYERFPAVTYNLGFLNCSGEYIAINDPDDISLPERIEAQIKFLLENPLVGVVGCNCYEFNDEIKNLVETTVEKNICNAAPPVRNPCLMLRKEVLAKHGLWNWKSEFAADFEWLYRFYVGGVNFYILNAPYVMYRKSHGTNISQSKLFNQGLKVAIFRTWFGLKLINKIGFNWWYATLRTYAFLFIKYPFRFFMRIISVR